MDSNPTAAERFAAWSDLASLFLLGANIAVGGITPVRHAWGRTPLHKMLLATCMTLTIVFSAVRFIVEGIFVTPGPREFLVASTLYVARWLSLFISKQRKGSRSERAYLVACKLRDLRMVRCGLSTDRSRREGLELVVRRGAAVRPKGDLYWRGVIESVVEPQFRLSTVTGIKVFLVRLVEEKLHSRLLDEIGIIAYQQSGGVQSTDDTFRKIYDLVRTVEGRRDKFVVDFSPFLSEFYEIPSDVPVAVQTGATDESKLGDVARRVAADACYYIESGEKDRVELRTGFQVQKINECIERSVTAFLVGSPVPDILQNDGNEP